MGGTPTLSDLGFQPQTAQPQAPAAPHPLADLGFKPAQQSAHPLADLGFKPVATPTPAPSAAPAGNTISPHTPGTMEQLRGMVANSAIGTSLEQAMPKVADALNLHPSETVNSPTYQQDQGQLLAPQYAGRGAGKQSPDLKHSGFEDVAKGVGEAAGGLTTPGMMAAAAIPVAEGAAVFGETGMKLIPRLVSGGFSLDMLHGLYQKYAPFREAMHQGDYAKARELAGQALIEGPMAALTAHHAVHGGPHAAPPEEKPVLHDSNDVEELRASAERQAPKIGDAVAAAAKGVDGAKLEAVRDSKDTDRITDKAERQGVELNQIADIAAAKITVPDQAAADKVLANLHEQMQVESVNGSLTEPGKNGVRQVQAVVNTGAEGEPVKRAEVLIQTPEMAAATAKTHDDYRKAQELRADGKDTEADALEAKITREHEAAASQTKGKGKSPEPAAGGDRGVTPAAETKPKYDFGNTQTNIPHDSDAGQALAAVRAKIAPEDLRASGFGGDEKGLETEPHVTVRYGIKGEDTAAIEKYLRSQPPFEAKLGKLSTFPPNKNTEGAAVLKADVDAPELHRMNAEIHQHGDFEPSSFPDYKPHATVAYVKPEAAEKYAGQNDTDGKTFTVRSVAITDRNGNAKEIPLQGSPKLAERPDLAGHEGRATEVLTPTRRMPSTYRLVEAADLMPSHNAQTFEENADYPKGVQERDYKGSKEAQSRVIQQAQSYDPAYTVNTNPDAVNGPPVVTPDGTVLGGNSRAMSTQRLYAEGNGDKYRETLKRDAATYGLTPEHVDGMKQPVLVRQIERPGSVDDARRIGSELNKSMTGALGVSERAVSAGKNLKPETLRTVADMMQQDDSSLRELLSRRGPELLRMMTADGAITERERPQFVDAASGGLSEEGKTFFERALMGSVIDDPRLMNAAPKSILGKLERSLGSIASFGSRPDEWNLLPALRQAVAEHVAIEKNGSTVDLHLNQRSMFGPERNPVVDALVRTLDEKPNAVRSKLEQFSKDADQNPHGQTKMFGGGDAYDAFNHAFGSKLTDEEYHNANAQVLRTDPAAERKPEAAKARDAGVPQRSAGEQAQGGGAGDGQPNRAPKPPGTDDAGLRSTGRPAELKAPKPPGAVVKDAVGNEHVVPDWMASRLPKAPKPPGIKPDEAFKPGRQSTPVQVRDADGNWQPGTLDYYHNGANGTPQGRGRVTLANGDKIHSVAAADMKSAPQTAEPKADIGIDFDGTLAKDTGNRSLGAALPERIASVKKMLAEGKSVEIITRRVENDPTGAEAKNIQDWLEEQGLPRLAVTDQKTAGLLYDDNAHHAPSNENTPLEEHNRVRNVAPGGEHGEETSIGPRAEQLGAEEVSRGTGAGGGDRGGDGKGSATGGGMAPHARDTQGIIPVSEGSDVHVQRDSRVPAAPRQDGESNANEARSAKRKEQLDAAVKRTQRENAANHKSEVVEVAGHKALVLDPDGEGVWHRLFRKIKDVNGKNPLGAGANWTGMSIDKTGVNTALAYLHGATGDLDVSGMPDGGAKAGYERLAKLLKDARNEQGGATILRGDYRADTAREEATHQWQREHGLDRSEAMREVASRPEFVEAADQLRSMGYEDATPGEVADEMMAKAMAGDPDFKITDEQREDLVRSFLTEVVEEKGPAVLKNLPQTDPRLKDIVSELQRGYDYGEQYDQRDERGGGPPARGGDGQAGREAGQRDDRPRETLRDTEKRGDGEGGQQRVPKAGAAEGELKPPEKQATNGEKTTGSNEPVFQRDKEAEKQNPWYLKSERILEQKMKGPMPGDALVRMLENNGVKADELRWSGLEDLKDKAKVTPDQVAEHIRENAIKVKEVTHGAGKPDVPPRDGTFGGDAEFAPEGGAKYGNYTLPGGENYRELLLTMPERLSLAQRELEAYRDGLREKYGFPIITEEAAKRLTPEEREKEARLFDAVDWKAGRPQGFKSGHWDEPNVLAHVRMNDRTTPDSKKLLHIEEIQSDWHQKGRDKGYETPERASELAAAKTAVQQAMEANGRAGSESIAAREELERLDWKNKLSTPEGKAAGERYQAAKAAWTRATEAEYAARNKMEDLQRAVVPDAPFKKDWHEMAFRRAVKYAADNGYDGVSWTPGEKQAERYDLSKQVKEIDYTQDNRLMVRDKNGNLVHNGVVAPEKLPDIIGKEAAQKLLDAEPKNHSGLGSAFEKSRTLYPKDLMMGGEGMKGFYDKIIPDYARKFGKQWGAKVDETEINGGKTAYKAIPSELMRGEFQIGDQAGNPRDNVIYRQEEDAANAAARLNKQEGLTGKTDAGLKVPYLEITPEMRKDVAEQGVPLFQKAKDEENPVARSVSDLVDDLKKLPKAEKGTALDRVASWTKDTVEDSLTRSGKALGGVPSGFEKAFAWAKATTAALVHDYQNPIEQTDWKTQAGQMQLSQTETALRLQDLAKELKAQAPKPLDRIAMTHWMEAAGSEAKLKEWQAGAKARAMQAIGSDRARYLREAQQHYDTALNLTPEQKTLALRLRQHFNDTLDIAKKNGLLEFGYRNYVMHLYEKADAANILHLVDTSELNPDPSFIKKRFHDTFYSAEGAGLTPKSKDIGYLLTAYDKSMNEAISSRNFMRSLLDAKAPDGRPIAAIKTRGGWVIAKDSEAPEVLNQRERPKSLEGYRDFDRPQLRNFLFKPTTEDLEGFDPKLFEEDPEKLAFRGDLIIHPKYASRVEDMLTPSWFERGEGGVQKLGSAIVKGSALAKEMMTAVAPFHMVQEGVHGMEHKVNPFKLPKIDLTDKTQRLLASHGLTLTNYDAEGLFGTKALKGIGEFVPGLNKAMDAMQSFSRWQFEDYIPRLKMSMANEAFERNVKRYPNLSEEQVAELTAKQSNAAFGNLNTTFDSIPRTKTFKTLLRLATFAPDFLESRMRFVGQAFTKYGGEQRAALIRGALAMYTVARVTNALMNNGDAKWDAEHAFSIVRNGRSYSLRTVQGDILHAVTDPRGFIYNRLNPLTTRPIVEFLSGRDQMGRQKSALSEVKDLGKSTLPFGLQKIIQTPDEDWLNSILTSTGLESRNYRTPTEEAVHKLYIAGIPDMKDDEEKQAETRKMRGFEDKVRSGHMTPADVWKLVEKGEITPKEAGRTVQRAQKSRLQIEFSGLHLKDAIDVYAKATPLEQAELKPQFARKQAAIADLPEAQREKTAEKMQELLAENQDK